MEEELNNAVYMVQLGIVMKYLDERNEDLFARLTEPEWHDLFRYFRLGSLPNPDENEAAADIMLVHRRQVEAADPTIRERAAALVDRLEESGGDGE